MDYKGRDGRWLVNNPDAVLQDVPIWLLLDAVRITRIGIGLHMIGFEAGWLVKAETDEYWRDKALQGRIREEITRRGMGAFYEARDWFIAVAKKPRAERRDIPLGMLGEVHTFLYNSTYVRDEIR